MKPEKCICPAAGYCERIGRNVAPREHAWCSGQLGDAEQTAKMQQALAATGRNGRRKSARKKLGAIDVAKGAVGLAKAALGIGHADEATIQARRAVCGTCPENDAGVCRQCGCFIEPKTTLAKQVCPLDKWPSGEAASDQRSAVSDQPGEALAGRLTIGVTMFRRPGCTVRLVESIRRRYPDVAIHVADNGDRPADLSRFEGIFYHRLPFDCGLSAARNFLVEHCPTELLMICEEDFRFDARTRIEDLVDVLDSDEEIGIAAGALEVGGKVRELSREIETFRGQLLGRPSSRPWSSTPRGTSYQLADFVFNFFVARRECLLRHRWDESLKVREHFDHALEVKLGQTWRVAFVPSCVAVHEYHRPNDYTPFRQRAKAEYDKAFKAKRNITHVSYPPATPLDQNVYGDRPNLVVLGIGHSGTSILTHMLATLGWHWGVDDSRTTHPGESRQGADFAEHAALREMNDQVLAGAAFDRARAAQILRALPQPWSLKDPRFLHTLDHWRLDMAQYRPTLIWITRERAAIEASYRRRGNDSDPLTVRGLTLPELEELAARHYRDWPWGKVRLHYEDLAAAVALFRPRTNPEYCE